MSRIHAAVAVVIGAVLLTGCSAAIPEPPKTSAPSASEQPAPEKTDAQPADDYVVPDACKILALTPGVSMDGGSVAQCAVLALHTYASGAASIESDDFAGDVVFTYVDSAFSYNGKIDLNDESVDVTYINRETWVDRGDGAERVDLGANGPDVTTGVKTQLWEAMANPGVTAAFINGGEQWQVGEPKDITLGDGSTVKAFPLTNPGPITQHEITAQNLTVWFTERAVPVAIEGELSLYAFTSDFRTTFYDLGSPVTIAPVG